MASTGDAPPRGSPARRRRRRIGKHPGTPIKFDVECADKIVRFLRVGSYMETAARAAGISKATLYEWLQKGGSEDAAEKYPRLHKFAKDVEEAQGLAEVGMLGKVASAAEGGQWQAAAWLLERKFPERWRRKDQIEHVGPDGGPIQEVVSELTSEQRITRMLELEAKARGTNDPGPTGPTEPG